ncbi:hypothetical protein C7441_103146 [Pseudaminobacter salicylatoxidans]|uniref:Uncharacterized protein n=1 Tax=Pseudaminobacter salicylatoxidans TaxID=93369 RepID=A0A316C6D8_PSESE|nr:hypothetical protein [Pseudaminobacter salicylatoxidans]PWJ85290.1 hypothetical protein C7441_103146 [Pseudaminobacter salicylatoxidans]
MLARRFTIVCLLMALFGMFLSLLVAHEGRSRHGWEEGMVRSCVYESGMACNLISRN